MSQNKKSKHPVFRDKFRGFLVNKSLTYIVFIFLAALLMFAGVLACVAIILEPSNDVSFTHYYYLYLQKLLSSGDYAELEGSNVLKLLSLISNLTHLISVTIFLGAVVYKVTVPKRNLMIFKEKIELDKVKSILTTSFYSSTPLTIYRLKITCFVKYYEPHFNDGSENLFPMNVFEVENTTREMPAPYNYIPTGVTVPIKVLQNEQALSTEDPLCLVLNESNQHTVYIFGKPVSENDNAFCRLYIMVEGSTPQAPGNILEVYEYDLLKDISLELSGPFRSRYNAVQNEYKVNKWEHF